jgi:hypothetical protein
LQNAHNITVDESFTPASFTNGNFDNESSYDRKFSSSQSSNKSRADKNKYNDDNSEDANNNNTTLDNSDEENENIDIDSKSTTERKQKQNEYEEHMNKLQSTALFNSLLNSNIPFLNPTSATNNMQPFLIEGHDDDLFQTNFVPCMVYLPVKSKLSSSVSIKITLKPLIDDDNSMQKLVKNEPVKE